MELMYRLAVDHQMAELQAHVVLKVLQALKDQWDYKVLKVMQVKQEQQEHQVLRV
jgi:hypothetical protein